MMIAVPTENEINELRYFHCMAWKVLEMEQQARVRQLMRRGWLIVEGSGDARAVLVVPALLKTASL